MFYENYERKVYKFANIFKIIKRFRILIIAILLAIMALTASFLAVLGNVSDISSIPEGTVINYGDSYDLYDAKATFKKDVSFKYRLLNSGDEWIDKPNSKGTWQVKAVSNGAFGVEKSGNIYTFEIVARKITVKVSSSSVVYGGKPNLSTTGDVKLVSGDKFECDFSDFEFDDITQTSTTITPKKSIAIVDGDGVDVTDCYDLTIEKSTINILPVSTSLSVESDGKEYNGAEQSSQKTAVFGSLVEGDRINTVKYSAHLTSVGSIAFSADNSVSILNSDGKDVTAHYHFNESVGMFSITKRQVALKTENKEFIYNGQNQTFDGITAQSGLVNGHTVSVVQTTPICNVGTCDNILTAKILDNGGADVTENYDIRYTYGTLKVVPPQTIVIGSYTSSKTYDGTPFVNNSFDIIEGTVIQGHTLSISQVETPTIVGTFDNNIIPKITDSFGVDVTSNYNFDCESHKGKLTILKRNLTVKAKDDASHVYDGAPYLTRDFEVVASGDGLAYGQSVTSVLYNEQTIINAGVSEFSIVNGSVVVSDSLANNVTSNYEISLLSGEISILKRDVTIKPQDLTATYNGYEVKPQIAETSNNSNNNICANHTISATFLGSSVNVVNMLSTSIDTCKILDAGQIDVSANYNINFENGYLTVTKRIVNVRSGSLVKKYNGEAFSSSDLFDVSSGANEGLVLSHALVAQNVQAFTEVKRSVANTVESYPNQVDLSVFDNDLDVSFNYDLRLVEVGTITINPIEITVTTNTNSWVYNGEYQFDDGFEITPDTAVLSTHKPEFFGTIPSILTKAESPVKNEFVVGIYELGIEKTHNYEINYVYGNLSITERDIKITSNDGTKVYDGTPLTNESVISGEGELVATDRIITEFSGTQTDFGTSQNTFTATIRNNEGVEVTTSYNISYVYGELSVAKRSITVKPQTVNEMYTGQVFGATDVEICSTSPYDFVSGESMTATFSGSAIDFTDGVESAIVSSTIKNTSGKDVTNNYTITTETGIIIITKRPLSVKPVDVSAIYNGLEVTAEDWEYTSQNLYELPSNHILNVEYYGSSIDVAKNVETGFSSLQIFDLSRNNKDVSENFTITEETGTLEVTKRTLLVRSGSLEKTYNGIAVSNDSLSDISTANDTGLVLSHRLSALNVKEFVDVLRDPSGNVIAYQNEMDIEVYDEDRNVTSNYDIELSEVGEIKINPVSISVTTNDDSKVYDGKPLTNDGYTIKPPSALVLDHEAQIFGNSTSITRVSESPAKNELEIKIYSGSVEKTSNYEIEYVYGTLTITKRTVYIETLSKDSFVYNGQNQSYGEYLIDNLADSDVEELSSVTYVLNATTATNPAVDNVLGFIFKTRTDSVSVTDCYDVDLTCGKLSVKPRPVCFKANDLTKPYDGTPLFASENDLTDVSATKLDSALYPERGLLPGFSATANFVGSAQNVGEAGISRIVDGSIVIVDGEGNSANSNFEITINGTGEITITKREITIKPEDVFEVYNEQEYFATNIEIIKNTLVDGHIIVAQFSGSAINASTVYTYITSFDIFDDSFNVFDDNYDVTCESGKIVIEKRQITISTPSLNEVYDGKAHSAINPQYNENELVLGQYIEFLPDYTSETEAGTYKNIAKAKIYADNTKSREVTSNYEIKEEYGEIIISKRPLSLEIYGATYAYDGTDKTKEGYEIVAPTSLAENQQLDLSNWKTVREATGDEGVENSVSVAFETIYGDAINADNYDVNVLLSGDNNGKIIITKRAITLQSNNDEWTYDGANHSNSVINIIKGTLAPNQEISILSKTEVVDVVEKKSNVLTYSIKDQAGDSTYANYDITILTGELTITKRFVAFKPKDMIGEDAYIYDGEAHTLTVGEDVTSSALINSGLVAGHTVSIESADTYVVPGTYSCRVSSVSIIDAYKQDVTSNYDFANSLEDGQIEINPRPITIKPQNVVAGYDGNEHMATVAEVTSSSLKLVGNDYIEATFDGVAKDVTKDPVESSIITYTIRNEAGDDVTLFYSVEDLEFGTIRINPRAITVTTPSEDFVYDGKEHYSINPIYDENELVSGHVIEFSDYATIKNYDDNKRANNTATVKIYEDETKCKDVTANYEIKKAFGTITISKRPLKINVYGKTWTYDGEKHTNEVYDIDETTSLAEGENLIVGQWASASLWLENYELNGFTYSFKDAVGNVVSRNNYDVEWVGLGENDGKLVILKREITVTTASKAFVYNGKAQSFAEAEVTLGTLVDGHKISADKNYQSVTDYTGQTVENIFTVNVLNSSNSSVRNNYAITYIYGTLEILQREISIKPKNLTGEDAIVYDGIEHSLTIGEDVTPSGENVGLVSGQRIVVETIGGGIIPKVYDCEISNVKILDSNDEEKTANYKITTTNLTGQLEIITRAVTIKPENVVEIYDAKPHSPQKAITDVSGNKLDLVDGHRIIATISGEQTNATLGNPFVTTITEYDIVDGNDVSVKAYYAVTLDDGEITINQREIGVSSPSYEGVYDGLEHSANQPIYDEGELVETHTIEFLDYKTVKDVSDSCKNTFNVVIFDENLNDVTKNYHVNTENCGTLTVLEKEITVNVRGNKWVFDGEYHSNSTYFKVNNSTPLVNGETLNASNWKEVRNVNNGGELNGFTPSFTDRNGNAVESGNYKITFVGNDKFNGMLIVEARPITVKSGDGEWIYDAQSHSNSTISLTEGTLVSGGYLKAPTEITSVTNVTNGTENYVSIEIMSTFGNDTDNYSITKNYGTLKINPRPVTLRAETVEKYYNGKNQVCNKCIDVSVGENTGLVSGHSAIALYIGGGTIPGEYECYLTNVAIINVSTYASVTDNYTFTQPTENGTIKILPRPISFTANSANKQYDGEALVLHEFEKSTTEEGEALVGEHYAEVTFSSESSIIFPGTVKNIITGVRIFEDSSLQKDVSSYYSIEAPFGEGNLVVTARKITYTTGSGELIYNGQPQSIANGEITFSSLVGDDEIVVTNYNAVTDWKRTAYDNTATVTIYHDGVDVTDTYYEVNIVEGKIKINKRNVYVTTGSASWVYNGENQSSKTYNVAEATTDTGFVEGHDFLETSIVSSYIKLVGSIDNIFTSYKIVDLNSLDTLDVTKNYNVEFISGELEITARPITVQALSKIVQYNANNQVCNVGEDVTPAGVDCGLVLGQTISLNCSGGGIIPGVYACDVIKDTIVIKDGNNDVTYCYSISTENGSSFITIKERNITIKPIDTSKPYDGTAETLTTAVVSDSSENPLCDNQIIDVNAVQFTAAQSTIGEHTIDIVNGTIKIIDTTTNSDVTKYYKITTESGIVDIYARPVTVKTADDEKIYDGTELVAHSYEITDGVGLLTGHRIEVEYSGTITDYVSGGAENTASFKVLDLNNQDVTNLYNITSIFGTLTINRRIVEITTDSDSFVYDGAQHYKNSFEVTSTKQNTGIIDGQTLVSVDYRTEINAGIYENTIEFDVIDNLTSSSKSSNYILNVIKGTLEITKREITVQPKDDSFVYDGTTKNCVTGIDVTIPNVDKGLVATHTITVDCEGGGIIPSATPYLSTIKENGVTIYDADGKDVTANYQPAISSVAGNVMVLVRPIMIKPEDVSVYYDGQSHSPTNAVTINNPGFYSLVAGHSIVATFSGQATEIVNNQPTTILTNHIVDNDGNDVTDYYAVDATTNGSITINKRPITITTSGGTHVYDNTQYKVEDYTPSGLDVLSELGHYLTVNNYASITEVGSIANTAIATIYDADGADISDKYYDITLVSGTLEVTGRPISITTEGASWTYDGLAHSNPCEYQIASGEDKGLLSGHSFTDIVWNEITDWKLGGVVNEFTFRIVDSLGADVSSNYNVSFNDNATGDEGKLIILKREISYQTASDEWVYNDESFSNMTFELISGSLAVGDTVACQNRAFTVRTVTEGTQNVFSLIFRNESGKAINNNYALTLTYGTLVVKPRTITIKPVSATEYYDGTEKSITRAETTADSLYELCDGHTITVSCNPTRTAIGDSDCSLNQNSAVIKRGALNVTSNYNIIYSTETATLSVIKRVIVIAPESIECEYDGEIHKPTTAIVIEDSVCGLLEGHSIVATFIGSATNYTSKAVSTTITGWQIIDSVTKQNVAEYYSVTTKSGEIIINKRKIDITTASDEWTYDGLTHSATTPIYDETQLVSGHMIEFSDYKTVTDYVIDEDNTVTVKIYSDNLKTRDVTSNYDIESITLGKLSILKRDLIINVEGHKWEYDGNAHTYANYAIDASTSLAQNQTIEIDSWNEVTDFEKKLNGFEFTIKDSVKNANIDLTNYNYSFVGVGENEGFIEIVPRAITVETESNENLVYDGTAQKLSRIELKIGSLLSGHTLAVDTAFEQASAKLVSDGVVKNEFVVKVVDSSGEDVSANYAISYIYGNIAVVARNISIKAKDVTLSYTGETLTCTTGEDVTLTGANVGLASGDKINVVCTGGGVLPNSYDCTVNSVTILNSDDENVTSSYNIDSNYGTGKVTIIKRKITVTADSAARDYDGTELSVSNAEIKTSVNDSFDAILPQHLASYDVVGSITEIGKTASIVNNFKITENGADVTNLYYDVELKDGEIEVKKIAFMLTTNTLSQTYNGVAISEKTYKLTVGDSIVEEGDVILTSLGHYMTVTDFVEITNYNENCANSATVKIFDKNGVEVTDTYYDLTVKFGRLTIRKRRVYVTTESQSFLYDGTTHSYPCSYSIEDLNAEQETGLLAGHSIQNVGEWNSIVNFGQKPNSFDCDVLDNLNSDVSSNYTLIFSGKLSITKRDISIELKDATVSFNGENQTCSEGIDVTISGEDCGLVAGSTIEVVCEGGGTARGSYTCTVKRFIIKDANGYTVTNSYAISESSLQSTATITIV